MRGGERTSCMPASSTDGSDSCSARTHQNSGQCPQSPCLATHDLESWNVAALGVGSRVAFLERSLEIAHSRALRLLPDLSKTLPSNSHSSAARYRTGVWPFGAPPSRARRTTSRRGRTCRREGRFDVSGTTRIIEGPRSPKAVPSMIYIAYRALCSGRRITLESRARERADVARSRYVDTVSTTRAKDSQSSVGRWGLAGPRGAARPGSRKSRAETSPRRSPRLSPAHRLRNATRGKSNSRLE